MCYNGDIKHHYCVVHEDGLLQGSLNLFDNVTLYNVLVSDKVFRSLSFFRSKYTQSCMHSPVYTVLYTQSYLCDVRSTLNTFLPTLYVG